HGPAQQQASLRRPNGLARSRQPRRRTGFRSRQSLHAPDGPPQLLTMSRVSASVAAALAGLLALLAAAPARAQFRPEAVDASPAASGEDGREITIELDTARGRNAERSLGLALLGSALLPGAGELYLREDRAAKSFLM